MRHLTILSALAIAAFGAAPASPQALTLTNLKGPVARICKVAEAKSIAELWRQIAACNVATPVPPPPPLSGTLIEGDSLSVFWPGGYTGVYAAAHPSERIIGKAVGGSGLATLVARFDADAAERPARVTVLIGANGFDTGFLGTLAAYAARWKATGAQVYLSTVTPQCSPAFNAQRNVINPGIRTLGYPVIDFAADPVIGPDAAGCDKTLFADGVHQAEAGTARMALIYGAKLDGKPAPGAPAPAVVLPTLEQGTMPAWDTGQIPGKYNPDEGAFRFVCGGDGPLRYDDPVVYPGQPGKAHLHQVWGNRQFDASLTTATLLASASTNCNDTPFSLNRSSYWQPALVHDSGQVIRPDLVMVYYKRKTAKSAYCAPDSPTRVGTCVDLPPELRFITGWDQFNPAAPIKGASWICSTAAGHHPNIDAAIAAGCKPGADLIANTVGPNCWNGKDVDSGDHRSHLAWLQADPDTGQGRCPATHPFLIPQQENKVSFRVTADMIGPDGKSRVRLSSDDMLPGAKPGETLHADYMEAWVASARRAYTDNCIDKALDCSGGDLGNGKMLLGAREPKAGWLNPTPRVAVPLREHAH